MMNDALKVAVTAPPEKGRANKAVMKLLAEEFGLPIAAVSMVSGSGSRRKIFRLQGVAQHQVEAWLAEKVSR